MLHSHPNHFGHPLGQLPLSFIYLCSFSVAGARIKYVRWDTPRERIKLIFNYFILMLMYLEETDLGVLSNGVTFDRNFFIFSLVLRKIGDPNRSLLICISTSRDIFNGTILYFKFRFLIIIDFICIPLLL